MTTKPLRVPNHLKDYARTAREYKARKRSEIKALRKAFDELWLGAAYIPREPHRRLYVIRRELEALAKECSAKEWGR